MIAMIDGQVKLDDRAVCSESIGFDVAPWQASSARPI